MGYNMDTGAPVGMGTCPYQVLAATLTLFQPEGADYAHHIMMSPPSFEIHRPAWDTCYFRLIKELQKH